MANNITPKLKAYVQIDGTGRVVSGTPVFRYSKPKSGTWREIPMYYRGNSSTTTTTTAGGGGSTVTAFVKQYWYNTVLACTSTSSGNLLFYSSSPTIEAGVRIFLDAALTTPVPIGYVISRAMFDYSFTVGNDGVLSITECGLIGTYSTSSSSTIACDGSGTAISLRGDIANDPTIEGNFVGLGMMIGTPFYVRYLVATVWYTKLFTVIGPYVASDSGNSKRCDANEFLFAYSYTDKAGACTNATNQVLYTTTSYDNIGDGTILYTDGALTQLAPFPYIAFIGQGKVFDCVNGILSNQTNC